MSVQQTAINLLKYKPGFLVWDTETTGVNPKEARIVSIGIVDEKGQTVLDTLINPEILIPKESTKIHGISQEMVEKAPTFYEIYRNLRNLLSNRIWVIYNKNYDTQVLDAECDRYNLPRIKPLIVRGEEKIWCAMLGYAEYYGEWNNYKNDYRWQKLSNAAEQCGIQVENAHNALADSLMTLEVIRHMASN